MNKRIVLTGGGSAGHVTPNIALVAPLQTNGFVVDYIGAANGVEKQMIGAISIPFHSIRSGKLRRYFSWQNFIDPFNVLCGIMQSYILLRRLQTDVVFSKGGFVALPVVIAAWLRRIPVIAHESDLTPGLANRLSFPFVQKICVTFLAAKKHFKRLDKVIVTGTPIRQELFLGDKEQGRELCGFHANKPCLLVMGGGQGSSVINQALREALDRLCEKFQVIHLCGPGKLDKSLCKRKDYIQFEYANAELPHLLALSDIVVSRSGANSLYELLALKKPHVLIPLSAKASRGDQIQNANYFKQQEISLVIEEEKLTANLLLDFIEKALANSTEIIKKIDALQIESATNKIVQLLKECNASRRQH